MKKLIIMAVLVLFSAPAMGAWSSLADNPAWWPYGDYPLGVGGQPSPSLQTQGLTDYSGEANYAVPGYIPRSNTGGAFVQGKYYTIGGYGAFDLLQDPLDPNSAKYWGNRESGNDIYDPVTNTWSSSKWDGTGPLGHNNGNGAAMPVVGQGSYMGTSQTLGYDWDGDGTKEIFVHAGYPIWGGNFVVYDPDTDTWSNSAGCQDWPPEGVPPITKYKAQYHGVAREVGGKIYCLGGGFWGVGTRINGQVYDICTDTWTILGEDMLPGAITGGFGGAVLGTDIYLLGGDGGSTQILKYDTVTNTLTNTGVTLLTGVGRSAAVAIDGKIWVLGGDDGANNISDIQIYDPVAGTVTLSPLSLPTAMSRLAAAYDRLTGTLYVGGGYQFTTGGPARISGNKLWSAVVGTPPKPGDVDGNGVVDGLDLTAVLTAWETVACDALWDPAADLDDNGTVDGLDLTAVISNWTVASSAAPEASAAAKPGKGRGGRGVGNIRKGSGNVK